MSNQSINFIPCGVTVALVGDELGVMASLIVEAGVDWSVVGVVVGEVCISSGSGYYRSVGSRKNELIIQR